MNKTTFDKTRPGASAIGTQSDESVQVKQYFKKAKLRNEYLGLPELSEVDVVRHYTNLSRENYGVDNGSYPLGSCTMKYNPKRNDKFATLSEFRDIHPHQPISTMPGVWKILFNLQNYISELTGMDHCSIQPAAGANGELTGLLIIRKYFEKQKQEKRKVVLIADSAHGTNPASAAMAGFECKIVATDSKGLMDIESLKENLDENVAALMLTNPSTLGLFEERIEQISEMIHDNGSLLYYDGANLNALMGIVRPGDMGFDVVHINTHKTLSTPHGGGGPGAGPVGVKKFLYDYLPTPLVVEDQGGYIPDYNRPETIGPMKAYFGHTEVLIRAYCYILTMGPKGLKEATEHAVLNANYLQEQLRDLIPPVYEQLCMHECLLKGDDLPLSTYNFAKRLIDYNVHPPTLVGAGCVYFSEDLKAAMLIEPTETETKQDLDNLISVFRKVIEEAKDDKSFVEQAPYSRSVSKIAQGTEEVQDV